MKRLFVLLLLCSIWSCGQDKIVLLPAIENAKITDVKDVSPAYIFYNETSPDSVELNRKNLIGTTNWLVNVDQRLTLAQAMPKIKFLQDKKRNKQMHKNENARNYFTCNDMAIKNLGFIDFTDVNYALDLDSFVAEDDPLENSIQILVHLEAPDSIVFEEDYLKNYDSITFNSLEQLIYKLDEVETRHDAITLNLSFNAKLTFQDYITFKFQLEKIESEKIQIANNEFIN